MLKTFPGWVPFDQQCRVTKRLRSPDVLNIFGYTFSRNRLKVACRSTLGCVAPLIRYFLGIPFSKVALAPLVPTLVTTMVGIYSTTGGVMYNVFSGASSLYMVLPSLAIIYSCSAGEPWIGVFLALMCAWVAMFFWSWVDPTKRAIGIPKIYSLLVIMLSFQPKTLAGGWVLLSHIASFSSVIFASGLCMIWLTDPLCVLMCQNLAVALYNNGVILDAVTQPLLGGARSEALPHFSVHHPSVPLNNLRTEQLKHNEEIALLKRELPFEAAFAEEESSLNSTLFHRYLVVNDCITSLSAFAARGSAINLFSPAWYPLSPLLDQYVEVLRIYISEINRGFASMYSGNGYVPDFSSIREESLQIRRKLYATYLEQVKQNSIHLPGATTAASVGADHWIFIFLQLWKALNGLATDVESACKATSKHGFWWHCFYKFRAMYMPLVLLVVSLVYVVRCALKIMTLPFRAIKRSCCPKAAAPPDSSATVSASPADASAAAASTSPIDGNSDNVNGAPASQPSSSPSSSPKDPSEGAEGGEKEGGPMRIQRSVEKLKQFASSIHLGQSKNGVGDPRLDPRTSTSLAQRDSVQVEMPTLFTSTASYDAIKSEKKHNKIYHASLTLTRPPKIRFADYYKDGRWRFPIRFICVVTPVSILSIAFLMYWLPLVSTPWAISSTVVVMMPQTGATVRRFVNRVFGTVVGALLGQVTVLVCVTTHEYVAWGPFILIVFFSTYFHTANNARYSYFWFITMLTYSIVVVGAYPFKGKNATRWTVASYRFLLVMIGSTIGSLSSFIFQERALDRYLNVIRAIVAGGYKAVRHIHDSLSTQQTPDKAVLSNLSNEMTLFQTAAIALRFDAAAEVFYSKDKVSALSFLRYKARDICYSTRMQIYSALTGFGSAPVLAEHTEKFISQGENVIRNIAYEVDYISTHLQRNPEPGLLLLSTDQVNDDFKDLETHTEQVKHELNPKEIMQMSSHVTLLRLFSVLLHDVSRATEHYF